MMDFIYFPKFGLIFALIVGAVSCSQAKFSADGRSKAAENAPTTKPDANPNPPVVPTDPVTPGGSGTAQTPVSNPPNVGVTDPLQSPGTGGGTPVDVSKNPPVPGTSSNTTLPKPGTSDVAVLKEARVECSAGYDSSVATIDYRAPKSQKISMQVRGEFCPQSTNQLTVLFTVDYSASMGKHLYDKTNEVADGSDPLVNGSCGRLKAAQAIVQKLKNGSKTGDVVNVAILPFASAAISNMGTSFKFVSLKNIDAFVNSNTFCRYISQGAEYDSGGSISIDEAGTSSGTNYADAFAKSQALLSQANGQKLMYFITDGEPTIPKASALDSAIQAGTLLRSRVPNLTMNSMLLKSRDASAIDVLNKVTGSADRVKLAENADQLASLIVDFKPAAIDDRFGSAKIYASPYPEQSLELVSIGKKSEQVWSYLTKPFLLQGIQGQSIDNRVTVLVKGTDGSQHSSVITIRYTQE